MEIQVPKGSFEVFEMYDESFKKNIDEELKLLEQYNFMKNLEYKHAKKWTQVGIIDYEPEIDYKKLKVKVMMIRKCFSIIILKEEVRTFTL